jgi:hypothetical protein
MKVETQDGAVFIEDSPGAIVEGMKATDWSAPPKKSEYMKEVADNVETLTGRAVRSDGATNFLADLEQAGVIKITELSKEQAKTFTAAIVSGTEREPTP